MEGQRRKDRVVQEKMKSKAAPRPSGSTGILWWKVPIRQIARALFDGRSQSVLAAQKKIQDLQTAWLRFDGRPQPVKEYGDALMADEFSEIKKFAIDRMGCVVYHVGLLCSRVGLET